MGGGDHPIVLDPLDLSERREVAGVCMAKLDLEPIPALVDDVGDQVNAAYGAWPDRLYLIGADGTIVYQGRPGPFGFRPDELEAAIRRELGIEEAVRPSGRR